jgi:hypothetical protein
MKFLLALIPACLLAQSGLDRPNLGLMIDQHGFLRPVSGVSGSFLVGDPQAARALSFACSQAACVAKTADSILGGGAAIPAPEGPAVIAASDAGAIFYFRQSGRFAQLQNGALTPLDWSVDGELLSISASNGIRFAIRRDRAVWITASDGSVLGSLPSAESVLLLPGAVVYSTPTELVLRRTNASEMRFPCGGVTELFAMSGGWVEARSNSGVFALRTDAGRERVYQLPQPSSGAPRR